MQTSLLFRCVHISVRNEIDGCGPSVGMALPALVPSLHVECLVGNRGVMFSVHIIIMMTCYVIDLLKYMYTDRKEETVLLSKVCLYIYLLSLVT